MTNNPTPSHQRDTDSSHRPIVPTDVAQRGGWSGLIKHVGQSATLRAAGSLRCVLSPRVANAFGILMYHRLTKPPIGVATPTYNVPPSRFRAQLEGLLSLGYQAWPLRKALEFSRTGQAIPRNTFVVTFDDGYENNYVHAWPILKDLQIPATIFVTTAYLDSKDPFPFDDWSAAGVSGTPAESWRPLTIMACREMLDEGLIDIGTHTHTHADFRPQPEALRADLSTSIQVLGEQLDLQDATFALPYGTRRRGFSGPVLAGIAKKAGVLCSLTTENELVIPGSDPFDWGRFTVTAADTPRTIAARLDGWYELFRTAWRKMRAPFRASANPHESVSGKGRQPTALEHEPVNETPLSV